MEFKIDVNGIPISYNEIEPFMKKKQKIVAVKYIVNKTNCEKEYAESVLEDMYHIYELQHKPTKDISTLRQEIKQKEEVASAPPVPKCPKCGSTSITAGQRGYSFWTGFLGSNKTVNRCSNCGHTWTPGK